MKRDLIKHKYTGTLKVFLNEYIILLTQGQLDIDSSTSVYFCVFVYVHLNTFKITLLQLHKEKYHGVSACIGGRIGVE